jgi:phage-related protein
LYEAKIESYKLSGSSSRAFLWTPGNGLTDIGAGSANAINSSGTIAGGNSLHITVGNSSDPFLWTPTTARSNIGSSQNIYVGSNVYATTTAVNDSNVVILNTSGNSSFGTTSYRWMQAGGLQAIGVGNGYVTDTALGINNDNQVVGYYFTFRGMVSQAEHILHRLGFGTHTLGNYTFTGPKTRRATGKVVWSLGTQSCLCDKLLAGPQTFTRRRSGPQVL